MNLIHKDQWVIVSRPICDYSWSGVKKHFLSLDEELLGMILLLVMCSKKLPLPLINRLTFWKSTPALDYIIYHNFYWIYPQAWYSIPTRIRPGIANCFPPPCLVHGLFCTHYYTGITSIFPPSILYSNNHSLWLSAHLYNKQLGSSITLSLLMYGVVYSIVSQYKSYPAPRNKHLFPCYSSG